MGNNRKLTKGRLQPFTKCQHRGWGAQCHRCEQAEQLEVRANELASIVKNKGSKFPDYVSSIRDENGEHVFVKGGGQRFVGTVQGHKTSLHSVVADVVHKMREHATHLKSTKSQQRAMLAQ